jgi:outer membrane protein W
MKGSFRSSVLGLVVVLGFPALAGAQEFRNIEFNPFVTASAHTKSDYQIGFPQSITPIQEQFKLNNTIGGGVRFNVNTTRHWGEELFFSYEPSKAHFARQTPPTLDQSYSIRIYNFGVNAMYYLNEEEGTKTRPFLSVGLGGTVDQPTGLAKQIANDPLQGNLPGFETAAELALNYGVGFKRRLSDDFGFRLDVRGFLSRNPTFGLPRSSADPNAVVFPAFGAINTLEISAGVIFKFKR